MMAESSGLSIRQAEDFLKGLTDIISEELADGESIKVKGLGTFKTVKVEARRSVNIASGEPNEIAEHVKIAFVPSKELAQEVNAPFEFFETIELDDSVSEEELEAIEEEDDLSNSDHEPGYDTTSGANVDGVSENSGSDIGAVSESAVSEGGVVAESTVSEGAVVSESTVSEGAVVSESAVSDVDAVSDNSGSDVAYSSDSSAEVHGIPGEAFGSTEVTVNATDAFNTTVPLQGEETMTGTTASQYTEPVEVSKPKKHFRFGWGFIAGFAVCLIAVAIGMGFAFMTKYGRTPFGHDEKDLGAGSVVRETVIESIEIDTPEKSVEESGHAPAVTAEKESGTDVPTEVSDAGKNSGGQEEVKYDTISKTRYLTTMAKEYYGDFNLWPYIYYENQKILGHPDRIKPGTRVVIPPLSKYGVKNTPEDIAKAKKLGAEIYARYQ